MADIFSRHMRAYRSFGSFMKYDSSIFTIAAFETFNEQIWKPCEVTAAAGSWIKGLRRLCGFPN